MGTYPADAKAPNTPQPQAEHVLVQDEDSHWYVCPADKESEANDYFEAVGNYWRDAKDDAAEPREPDWLYQIGGSPTRVKFTGYRIE